MLFGMFAVLVCACSIAVILGSIPDDDLVHVSEDN